MNVMNSTLRNAIASSITSGVALNTALASHLIGTTGKQRDELIFQVACEVAACYTRMPQAVGTVEAYASRKGNSITFGLLMDDGSHDTTDAASGAARKWFTRNILKAGFISTPKAGANLKDSKADIKASAGRAIKRYTKAELRAYIALLQAAI